MVIAQSRMGQRISPAIPDQEATMKGRSSLPLLILAASACSANAGPPASAPSPLIWPAGEYVLEASVRYNEATPSSESTLTEDFVAYLNVAPDGSLTLTSSSGLCRDPLDPRQRREENRGRRGFECGDVTYAFGPAGGTIRGEMTARVWETFRVPGPCKRYGATVDGRTVCLEPSWRVVSRSSVKSARLRIF
jgi:hypothetical protein